MLENAQIIALQLIKMFIFIAIGFLLFKGKLITEKSSLAPVSYTHLGIIHHFSVLIKKNHHHFY